MEPPPSGHRVPSAVVHRVNSEELSPISSTPGEDPLEPRVFEPSPNEHVPVAVSERVENDQAPSSSRLKKAPPATAFPEAARPGWGFIDLASGPSAYAPPLPSPGLTQHRDTFELLQRRTRSPTRIHPRGPSVSRCGFEDLPFPAMLSLASLLDHRSFLGARLTCQSWYIALSHVRPLSFPACYRLPPEIVQAVYKRLSDPRDFDAARHACRAWMAASLDPRLLTWMIRKGGWWASWVTERERSWRGECLSSDGEDDEVWSMSRVLARECALTPISATAREPPSSASMARSQFDGTTGDDAPTLGRPCPFELVLETDCSALGDLYTWVFNVGMWSRASSESPYGLRFTPSVCGRFVLAYHGYRIFIYRLGQGPPPRLATSISSAADAQPMMTGSKTPRAQAAIYPVSNIVCPRRVLAVSMDTSSGRHAVAALLEDRMGLVCDLQAPCLALSGHSRRPTDAELVVPGPEGVGGEHVHWCPYPFRPLSCTGAPDYFQSAPTNIIFGDDSPAPHFGINPQASYYRSIRALSVYHPSNIFPTCVPITRETGPRSVFHGLGAADDPPLSVAICPQRRCVAFGCVAGIELHWVDALTGHSWNRWFPLAAPSDYLYFLPPRHGIDSAKKLRLVSSTGTPDEAAAIDPSPAVATGGAPESRNDRIRANADTIRAVPLSDGVHVAFTDPTSRRLCLGTDAPAGAPTRLSRKIVLEGPPNVRPSAYAVGRDLSWGARVAAAYGDELWLFSVPADVLRSDGAVADEPWVSTYAIAHASPVQPTLPSGPNGPILFHGTAENDEDPTAIWPIHIYGMRLAVAPQLAELAIDSRLASLTVWAFARDGMARAWQVRGAFPRAKRVGSVRSDGGLGDAAEAVGSTVQPEASTGGGAHGRDNLETDADGDIIMRDGPPLEPDDAFEPRLHPVFHRQLHYDGARSPLPTAQFPHLGSPTSSPPGGTAAQGLDLESDGAFSSSSSADCLFPDTTIANGGMRVRFEIARDMNPLPRYYDASSYHVGRDKTDSRFVTRSTGYGCITTTATYTLPGHTRPRIMAHNGMSTAGGASVRSLPLVPDHSTSFSGGSKRHRSSSNRRLPRIGSGGLILETEPGDARYGALEVTEDPGMLAIEIMAA